MHIKYTICFIKRRTEKGDRILMLYRSFEPNRHRWNGVGGKLEAGETPSESILREIAEETGLVVYNVLPKGIVTWNDDGGMYVFTAENDSGDFIKCDEGHLQWMVLDEIKESKHVVSNIKYFIDDIFLGNEQQEFSCTYDDDGVLVRVVKKELKKPIYT